MLRTLLLLLIGFAFVLSTPFDADAQYRRKRKKVKHRFNAGLILGGTLSQIDGDRYTGFDKAGIRAGVKGSMYLNDRLDLVIGFLYNEKGAKFEGPRGFPGANSKSREISYNYMEVPLLLNVHLGDEPRLGKGFDFEVGFSFSEMIDYKVVETVYDPETIVNYTAISESFNQNEFNLLLGGNYFFNQHFGLGLNYTVQLNKVYENPLERDSSWRNRQANDPATRIRLLRNYQVSLQLIYNIF